MANNKLKPTCLVVRQGGSPQGGRVLCQHLPREQRRQRHECAGRLPRRPARRRAHRRLHRSRPVVRRPQRRPKLQAQRGRQLHGRHRGPGRNRPLLERHRRQWRPGKRSCGWCKDKWGFSWQITPRVLLEANNSPDKAAAKRAFDAMMTMKKIDVAKIEAALRGEAVNA